MEKELTEENFKCLFCGADSLIDPSDQIMPTDYCHPSDHGEDMEEFNSNSILEES